MEEGHGRPEVELSIDNLVRRWGLGLAVVLGVGAYGGLLRLDATAGTLRDGHVPETIVWYLVAFCGFALAVVANEREPSIDRRILWLVPIGFRILLWFTEPTLSDDVYRYLWDGHLVTNGVNPYAYAVESAQLDVHDIGLRESVNNPGLSSPYLPAAQGLFGLVSLALPLAATSMQVVMSVFDLISAWLITILLGRAGLPPKRVLLFWWNPLVIVESAHGAHLDAFMVVLSLAAVVCLGAGRASASPTDLRAPATTSAAPRGLRAKAERVAAATGPAWSPLLLATATLTRGLPALLVAVLFWRWTWPQRVAYVLASAIPVLALGAGPGLGLGAESDGTGVFGSARTYAEQWQFNAEVFNRLLETAERIGVADPGSTARTIVGLAMGVVAGTVWLSVGLSSRRGRAEPLHDLRLMALLLMAYVLLTTTLHPWYLLGLMAFLAFLTPTSSESPLRWMIVVPWLYLAAAAGFSYLTYVDPLAHAERSWVRWLEWYPTLALLAAAVVAAVMSTRLRNDPSLDPRTDRTRS